MNAPAALAVGRRKDGVSPLIIDHRKIRMANATMLYSDLHFVVTKFPYLVLKRDPCLRRDLPFPIPVFQATCPLPVGMECGQRNIGVLWEDGEFVVACG
jgi:hypothetical protein